jgi:hypothetical protein
LRRLMGRNSSVGCGGRTCDGATAHPRRAPGGQAVVPWSLSGSRRSPAT